MLDKSRDGPVLRLTLNDATSRNALSLAMIGQITEALTSATEDQSVGIIVFAAQGPAFSSGHNLKELTARRADKDGGLAFFETVFETCARMMTAIARHRCPVIAEVDGLASAAGCQLVAACDLAYASSRATFCTPGVNIGLFCSTPMVPLSRTVAPKHAMEMLLTGNIVDAAHAERIGLINRAVPQNELRGTVDEVAQHIATKSLKAIAYGKPLYQNQMLMPLQEAYELSAAVMAKNMIDHAAREGIDAFIQKRKPAWPTQ